MGQQIDQGPHKTTTCNSRRGLKTFLQDDGTIDSYCFACQTYYPPEETKKVDYDPKRQKTPEEIQEEIEEVQSYPVVDIVERKLRKGTLSYYNAHVSMSEKDGVTPTAIYWPITKEGRLTGYHVKVMKPNKFVFNLGDCKGGDLIGWEQAKATGAYRLIITEGPEDMASVARVFEQHGKPELQPAVVSLPRGSGSTKAVLTKHLNDIHRFFKEVVLCFDEDESGRKALQEAMLILPYAKSAKLPYKDANECVMQGAAKALYTQLAFKIDTPKNTKLIFGYQIHEEAKKPPTFGEYTWPFPKMNEVLRGLRLGETSYGGSGVKMGKGELRNEIAAHIIKEHDAKVFMASFEEGNAKTYKKLAGKLASRIFHDPTIPFDEDAYEEAGKLLKTNLMMVNLYQHADWNSLKSDMREAWNEGATMFFIDPLTNLVNGIASGDANTHLQAISQDSASMALDWKVHIQFYTHLKAPEGNISQDARERYYAKGQYTGLGNCPHEQGGSVLSTQFTGSRAMMRSCNLMLGMEGNKDPELPEEVRNTRKLIILEEREFGSSGSFSLFWNKNTGRFKEM